MAFPPKLSPLCPEQMTAFPWICPKLGEGQLICSTNGGTSLVGRALCKVVLTEDAVSAYSHKGREALWMRLFKGIAKQVK